MAATIESQISRIESQIFSLKSQIETIKNIDGHIDEEMRRIFKSIYLDLKNKLDVLESMKKANLGITSDKKFNKLLYQKNEEEQCQSRGKKGKVILKKVTGKKFKKNLKKVTGKKLKKLKAICLIVPDVKYVPL